MGKHLRLIAFHMIIGGCLLAIYFLLFSYDLYNGQVKFVPSIYYPLIVIVLFISSFIYGKYRYKTSNLLAIVIAIVTCFSLGVARDYVVKKYDYLFEHYYSKTPYENLLSYPSYIKQKGNIPKVMRKLKEEGYKPLYIKEGFTDKYKESNPDELKQYTKAIYFVNDSYYVLFDWNSESILQIVNKEQISKDYKKLSNIPSVKFPIVTEIIIYAEKNGDTYDTKKIVPSDDNTIILVDE